MAYRVFFSPSYLQKWTSICVHQLLQSFGLHAVQRQAIVFLTLFCSVQQRAPTHQTEESHHRSCTQCRETLGRAQNFLDTRTLQLSCRLPPGQLQTLKSKNGEVTKTEIIILSVYQSLLPSDAPSILLSVLYYTCPSKESQKKEKLHAFCLSGQH